jgi:(R)-2-hydroxyacyl-CoA dehydratese activating ATPase
MTVPIKDEKVLGIDLGSRNVKICLMHNGTVEETYCIETVRFYRDYGMKTNEGFQINLKSLKCSPFDRMVATGYGRMMAVIAGAKNISELTAHFLGACFQTVLNDFILLDMGGQDYKVMCVKEGCITDLAANDKCAASTGRYLENIARVLGISLESMGHYYDNPIPISNTCALFGESEVLGLIARGEPVAHLAAGVNKAVVERVLPLVERMGNGDIVMSGGVAFNEAVVRFLSILTGRKVNVLPDPLHNGAIGCCVSKF